MTRAPGKGFRSLGLLACVLACVLALPVLANAEPAHRRVIARSGAGQWLEPGRDHVAISRELPGVEGDANEAEALQLVFVGFSGAPSDVHVQTLRSNGSPLDTLADAALSVAPCPVGSAPGPCWSTRPLRLTPDRLDRESRVAHHRSLEAELGGLLRVDAAGAPLGAWPVGAPHSPLFLGFDRLSVQLRVRVLRLAPGGAPSLGTDPESALRLARNEVSAAGRLWAQCGIDLQGPRGLDVQLVDPPASQLIAVGCDAGLPASGGQISLRAAGRRVRVVSRAGDSPGVVAERLARALRALGLRARLSPNPRMNSGASGSVDVLVQSARGGVANLSSDSDPAFPLSTDASLSVCLGEVDLGNGLSHFVENDASAGTVEERSLIKAFDDGDPSTIEVFIVPSFDQSGRIGESFIDEPGAAIQNTVIIDRSALRAGPRSNALAHELGHILLDMPGHPDDYGVDQASSLMDSDASDASAFGPRRLSLADCERALRQSGPAAKIPLLVAWPFAARSAPESELGVRRRGPSVTSGR